MCKYLVAFLSIHLTNSKKSKLSLLLRKLMTKVHKIYRLGEVKRYAAIHCLLSTSISDCQSSCDNMFFTLVV